MHNTTEMSSYKWRENLEHHFMKFLDENESFVYVQSSVLTAEKLYIRGSKCIKF
jgi:hypothetical protein